jgi:16S rRNA (uracil1498-N3)-methyltransferase
LTTSRSRSELAGPAALRTASQVFVSDLDSLGVSASDAHHLSRVLRLRDGEAVIAGDGSGSWRLCRYVGEVSDSSRLLEANGPIVDEPRSDPEVCVGFVPVKGERPEWVVQKLTEVGVDRIVLLSSARAVVRWDTTRTKHVFERLRAVAREAAAQSRRAWIPELDGVLSLDELADGVEPGRLALAEPGGGPLEDDLTSVAVGPEGGWTEEELAGRALVGLGKGILRAETAAIAVGLRLTMSRDHNGDGTACKYHAE